MTASESVAVFGQARSLVGILTVPSHPRQTRPAVVIINSGIIHRAGPNRLYVRLARELAELGHWVLRFDLSGIGDSGPPTVRTSVLESALADIGDAMGHLGSVSGNSEFILCGLCSGADQALIKASSDRRVVGVAVMDPTMFRTAGFLLRRVLSALARPITWIRLLTGRYNLWKALTFRWSEASARTPSSGSNPDASEKAFAVLRAITERDVHLCCVFTGGHINYGYRSQFTDYFRGISFGRTFRLEYLPDCSHTFSAEDHKAALMNIVVSFAAECWPPGADVHVAEQVEETTGERG